MTVHLEENLQRDLDSIRLALTKMAEIAARALQDCASALPNRNRLLAQAVILRDQRVDELEKRNDQAILEFILRHQPAGSHLRFAHAALQINFELERIGDYAESIARQTLKLIDLDCTIPSALFTEIASASIAMLRSAVSAFVRQDLELSQATMDIEERVDHLRNQVTSEVMHMVQNNALPLAALTPLTTIARRFERVSDQSKSICQATIFISTGEYLKHHAASPYRVLFLDDDHGILSRTAESIGTALKRSDVIFESAGISVRPATPSTESPSTLFNSSASSSLASVPVLDVKAFTNYDVVAALTPNAVRAIPTLGRKQIELDWQFLNSGIEAGVTGERHLSPSGEKELAARVTELVRAILGTDL